MGRCKGALLLRLVVALDVIDKIVNEQWPRGGLVVLFALRVMRVRQGELEELRPLVEGERLVRAVFELRDAARARGL